MPITSETYEPLKVDRLKRLLEIQASKEQPRYYEIYVDNLKVVPRTNDINEFDTFEDFVNETTQKIRILLYSTSPTSPRNDQYLFIMKETAAPVVSQSLNGFDIDSKIREQVSIERERWDSDLLKKDLDATKAQLAEAESFIEKLQDELEVFRGKKLHLGNVNLGELASVVLEGMIRRNPQMLSKLPGGEALAGIIEQDNKATAAKTIETEASFKKKDAAAVSEEDQKYISVIRQMEEYFEEAELQKVMIIIERLAEDTSQIDTVADLLDVSQTKNETT